MSTARAVRWSVRALWLITVVVMASLIAWCGLEQR